MNTPNLKSLTVPRTLISHMLRRFNAAAVSLSVLVFATAMFSAQFSFAVSPVLSAIGGPVVAYSEGGVPIQITNSIVVFDADGPLLAGATVQISANFITGEDELSFVLTGAITGSYDAVTGILSLTGPGTLAEYQSVLRSVRYSNSNVDHPSIPVRTISFQVNDGTTSSAAVTRNLSVARVNDAPIVSNLEAATLNFTEGEPATSITSALTIQDVDGPTISSATIVITGNFTSGQDVLAFTNSFGISGSLSGGTLTLTGVAPVADYQAALRTITYQNTNLLSPSILIRTLTIRVSDGALQSTAVTRTITIVPVNDAPVLSAIEVANLSYTESALPAVISANVNAVDVDDSNLTGAIVQITGNFSSEDVLSFTPSGGITGVYDAATGTMTLSGISLVTNYRNALRNVRYNNTNNGNPSTLVRTVSFTVNDAGASSNTVTRNITFVPSNDLPVLASIEAATLSYTEDDPATPISQTITVADVDNTTIASATVRITSGYSSGNDLLLFTDGGGITSSFNAATGLLTLTGVAPIATYETALRNVNFRNTSTISPSVTNRIVTFVVNDGTGNSAGVTRTISMTLVNDAPTLSAIESTDLAYAEGQPAAIISSTIILTDGDSPNLSSASIQITGNFVGSEDVLSFTAVAGITTTYDAATGTISVSGVNTIARYLTLFRSVRYRNSNLNTPSPLVRTVSFIISDGALSSNVTTRNIAVSPVNDAPTVVNDLVTTPEETAIDISVLTNDSDVDDTIDPTSVVITLNPANGTTSVDPATGVITYTPNAEFTGTNTIRYTVKDLAGGTSLAAIVTVTVSLINDAPSFTGGADISVSEDAGAQTVAAWATAINDGDPFTSQGLTFIFTNTNPALFASAPAINTTTGNLTFRSANNASGVATITVTLRDNGLSTPLPNVNLSDTKTFTITVLSVNDAPVGVIDYFSTSSNTPLAANAKTNDTDTEGNTTTLSAVPVVPPAHGSVVINSNGTFVYTPSGNYTGTDTFTYEICDNGTDNGAPASRCGQGVVSIIVNPINPAWNIVGNNSIELAPNSFVLTDELAFQQGAIWNRVPLDLHYSFSLDLNAIFSKPGTVRDVGADGIVFVFQRDTTPPPLNVPDLPIYARGTSGGSLGVGGITPSLAVEVDTYQNGGEPVFDHIAVNQNGDVWDNLAGPVPAMTDASNNPLNIEDGVWHTVRIYWDFPTKTIAVEFDGVQKITHTNDIVSTIFNGDPSNVYWGFSSSTGGQNNYQAVSDIIMTVINLNPIAGTDANTTLEDTAVSGTVLDNDSDPEATPLHVLAETKATTHGQVVILADGSYTYTPNANYNGSDTFTYQVCDSYSPAGCSTGTVNITITPVQDAPIGHPDQFTTSEDTKLIVVCDCIITNDEDVDGETLTAEQVKPVSHGTLELNPDGTFTYMPDKDFFGTDTFTYTATDGIDKTAETLVTIIVTPVNDPPVAADDVVSLDEDTPTELPILANDVDVDDQLTPAMVTVISSPAHGSITITTTGVLFTPDLNYNGPDAFTYTLTDPSGAVSNVANVSITILPVNDAPVAQDDAASTIEDVAVTIDILANDTDVDNALEPASVVVVSAPSNGTVVVNPNGTVIYTPEKDFTGNDSFSYTVKDVSGKPSEPSLVNVTVSPVNDAPVAANDAATTLENTPVDIHVTDNDFDVDNAVIPGSVVILTTPVHGTIVLDASGVITYTPATGYLGEDTFTYTIQDPAGLTSIPGTVVVTVVPPNRAPTAVDDGPIVHRFLLDLPIDVIANDYDVDNTNDELTIVAVTQPNVGSVTVEDNKIVYHPVGTTSAMVTFTYTISDPAGLTDEATVVIEYVYNPLMVSEGFSPNNDYNNDTWYILSIENYPNNHVKIFDRWGLLVYQKDHYENNVAPWDGRANSGQQAGKLLDQGTYYYMLDVGGELRMLSGFVMIVR